MATDTELGYFEAMYDRDPDPWGFDRRWYEQRKYALTMAALPRRRFARGLEAGCSNGALTELLAQRCDELFAFDFVTDAVHRTRRRLEAVDHDHVHVLHAQAPDYWPDGDGDLVVWSEVAYYLADESARRALCGLESWLRPDGVVVAVHYTGVTDYPRHGRDIGPWLDGASFLTRTTTLVDESFELGVWRRSSDGRS